MKIINNFELLKQLLKFEPGTYYKFVALVRAKDFTDGKYEPILSTNERGEIFIRQWFVDSEDSLDKYKDDMINLCKATKARLYVTTDRKSIKKTVFKMLEQLHDIIKQLVFGSYGCVSLRKLSKFSASASQMAECSDGPKYWLIDIDKTGMTEITEEQVEQIVKDFEYIFLDKKVIKFKTLNGYHVLIKRDFDFRAEFAKRWQKAKDGMFSINPLDVASCHLQNKVFERLWSYKLNNHYSDKENALTLVYEDLY